MKAIFILFVIIGAHFTYVSANVAGSGAAAGAHAVAAGAAHSGAAAFAGAEAFSLAGSGHETLHLPGHESCHKPGPGHDHCDIKHCVDQLINGINLLIKNVQHDYCKFWDCISKTVCKCSRTCSECEHHCGSVTQ